MWTSSVGPVIRVIRPAITDERDRRPERGVDARVADRHGVAVAVGGRDQARADLEEVCVPIWSVSRKRGRIVDPSLPKKPPNRSPLEKYRDESIACSLEVVPGSGGELCGGQAGQEGGAPSRGQVEGLDLPARPRDVDIMRRRGVEAERHEDEARTATEHGPAALAQWAVRRDAEVRELEVPADPEVAVGLVEAVVGPPDL